MSIKRINIAIVVTGKISSGKTTLAKYISEKYGWPIASFGGYIKSYCEKHNLGVDRKTLQDVGESFVKSDPTSFLDAVLNYPVKAEGNIIFEGVRHKAILDEIRKISQVAKVIFVEADVQTRFERNQQRNEKRDGTREDFQKSQDHIVEREIETLKTDSDLLINTAISDYFSRVDKFFSSIF